MSFVSVKKKMIIGLQLFVVAFGLMRLIGDTFQIKMLDQIGFASGFSPLPLVFSDRGGVEDFAHAMKINYVTVSGKSKTTYFDQKMYSSIKGPLSYVGTYSVAIAYSPRFPENFWKPALIRGFCHRGALAQAMHEQELIKTLELKILHFEKSHLQWTEKIECAL